MALNVTRPSRFKSYSNHCETDATEVTVYTCPDNCTAYMSLIFVTNTTANASDVSIDWYDANYNDTGSSDTVHILGGKNLGASEYIQLSSAFLVLEAGDMIKATADNTAGGNDPHIDVICTVEEVFLPVQG